jgi:hypothetical protein
MDKPRTLMIIDRALPNQNIQNVIAANAIIFHTPDLTVKILTAEKLGSRTTELYKHLMVDYELIQKNRSLKNIILEDKIIFLKSMPDDNFFICSSIVLIKKSATSTTPFWYVSTSFKQTLPEQSYFVGQAT